MRCTVPTARSLGRTNWWGQNTGPSYTDNVNVSVGSFLQLRLTSAANPALFGNATLFTADLFGRNSGGPVAAALLNGIVPVTCSFSSPLATKPCCPMETEHFISDR